MIHATHETAKGLKDAGFPQPEKTYGTFWYDTSDFLVLLSTGATGTPPGQILVMSPGDGVTFLTVQSEMTGWFFAPTVTDILAHLPGWALEFTENEWICYYRETGVDDFVGHRNPAEAWFFENSHAKK
jgi:hypothetical protein